MEKIAIPVAEAAKPASLVEGAVAVLVGSVPLAVLAGIQFFVAKKYLDKIKREPPIRHPSLV